MEVADGIDDRSKQIQPFRQGQPSLTTVARNRHPLDVFHHKIRSTFISHSSVQQPGDVWVRETGKELPLRQEASPMMGSLHVQVDEFQRHLLLELAVHPASQKDHAHSPLPNDLLRLIGTESDSRSGGGFQFQSGGGCNLTGEPIEESISLLVRVEKTLELAPQSLILTHFIQELISLVRRAVECGRE